MIIDAQRGFVVPETAPTVPEIERFVRRERHRYDVVVATRFVNVPGSLYETQRDWHEMMDGEDVALLADVARSADTVVSKHGMAPDPSQFLPILRDREVQMADLCGFDTDQCVMATALSLWDAGIVPRVLAQLCSSSGGREIHEWGLAILRRAIGDRNVVDTSGQPV